jgi:hypothetical protein
MNYQQPGNFLQDQGYFQINTSVKELIANPRFKLFLSGQYLLELVNVTSDSQFFSFNDTDTLSLIFRMRAPEFSSTMSETAGITFTSPLTVTHAGGDTVICRYNGSVKPSPNKILATLNGSIQLLVDVYFIPNTAGADATYVELSHIFNNGVAEDNMVFSFGFQYSKVK